MQKETSIIHAGRQPFKDNGSVNTPVHRTSTVLFPSLKAYHDAEKGKSFYQKNTKEYSKRSRAYDFSYGITGTLTNYRLQEEIAKLEDAKHALLFPSGLSAITTCLFAFTKPGNHILIADSVYGPTRRFCTKELKNRDINIEFYDPTIAEKIEQLITPNTKIIFTESPGSLTFEIQDIPTIANIAKKHNIITIMDNSWATPLYFNPFKHGIDISITAATKYYGGHSDIMLGTLTTNEDKLLDTVLSCYRNLGIHVSPDSCYLASRGLKTLALRIKQHEKSALELAKFLQEQNKVSKVLHPALSSHPQHKIFKRDFSGSTGLFSIILDKQYTFSKIANMIDNLQYFGIGCSWGGFESLIIDFDPALIRTASSWPHKNSCIRLYTGLENIDDLKQDITLGLKRL